MQALGDKTEKYFFDQGVTVANIISAEIQPFEIKMDTLYAGQSTKTQVAEEALEKICTQIQALETKLEKLSSNLSEGLQALVDQTEEYFLDQNVGLTNSKTVSKSELNLNGNETIMKTVDVVKEKTVPLSVLKCMKEIFGMPNSLTSGADLEENMYHLCQPRMSGQEFHPLDDVLHPSFCENSFGSFGNSSRLQSGNLAVGKRMTGGSEMEREIVPPCNSASQRRHKNQMKEYVSCGKRTIENSCDKFGPIETKMWKPSVLPEKVTDPSKEELMFLGQNESGDWKVHQVSDPEKLEELSKDYKNFKILRTDDF